ncbi:MAG: hypothetical protein QGH73_08660 [Rhodospirillales bacterium]|jgi:hypothetical protein|nr:hypothetical protein [Rhodospirillaceae bacterium]MDP6427890.1 hypothetical protein [Rhodospirillales bacterium]MDP6644415.1 hypothetical protein [Rhodospirillales bacterium]MDP6841737.1 hypothetical protein [Rhodospirillales bacterium]|tara:strand:+ start:1362 stop:1721 length:360 start_codon:yes stop_codon:yes gene_type:complete
MPLQAIVIIIHAVIGWGLCGATVGIGRKRFSMRATLIVHAIAAPFIFAAIASVYFPWFGYTGPLATAAIFTGVVVFLDLLVVALMIERSFDMFRSVLGTWLPFALIFGATWLTGLAWGI